jgi:hypothetical protein
MIEEIAILILRGDSFWPKKVDKIYTSEGYDLWNSFLPSGF